VFDISDQELDGIETGIPGSLRRQRPGLGSMPIATGEEDDSAPPAPPPASAPIVPSMAPGPGADADVRRGAGRALVVVTLGLVGGGLVGGAFGAAAGVVGVGAIRNLLRTKDTWSDSDPAVRVEAGKSATMAIFGLGIAGMLGYHAYKKHEEHET
jgi:hypothetical protein